MRFSATRWLARRADRLLSQPVALLDENGMRWDKDRVGRFGERAAARWLWLEGGCRILYRNFRAPEGGEVDITCRHGETLVFAEVKTRTSDFYGRPAFAAPSRLAPHPLPLRHRRSPTH
jgi:putative endonuclease